jgi:hypothetical protein
MNEHRIETVSRTLPGRRSLETQTVSQTLSGLSRTLFGGIGHCLLGGLWKRDFLPKSVIFFQNLILKLQNTKSDET